LKELAVVGRAGMLFALLEFVFTFFLFRHLLNTDIKKRFVFSKVNGIVATFILLVFIISAASLIRIFRGSTESFAARSTQLSQFRENIILTPTLYLYLSSDPGVLSKYLESKEDFNSEMNNTKIGQNTFLPIYSLLAKLGITERVSGYQRPYYIPIWTNTGTYIRELHADFGIAGTLLGAYLIGLIITWSWFKFYEKKNLILFAILVYFYLIIGFSFLVMVTRLLYWFISLIIIILFIPLLERISEYFRRKLELAREKT
jgi:oligosaccharide repeat unit polymerase